MKKFLTAFLFACSCTLIGLGVVGCGDKKDTETGSSDSTLPTPSGESRVIEFEEGEGYSFTSNAVDGKIAEGEQLIFQVDVGAFYYGASMQVFVNDKMVLPDADGNYAVTVGDSDLTVNVENVRKDISNMTGSGAGDDAFVVTRPIDLLYIAQQVNAGNRAYCAGAYILANDIDCKGEELEIIGDRSTESAIFSGVFSSVDSENRCTISNFTINSEDGSYVGLFGAVFADMSVESSGLFYGVSVDNFTINAGVSRFTDDNKTISCGGLVGYGVGANFFLCDATNGEINVTADGNYFSFVGGLVGYQQGFYESTYGMYYPSEISYSVVDADVNILGGVALYAGGITGYMATNYPNAATASVHNSYFTGSVNGALRSGGIAGGMGRYTVVSNCYAVGEISARSYQPIDSILISTDEYCHAYAGGLVGFAENDTIAHDSFFNGSVSSYTVSGDRYAFADKSVAGGYAAGNASAVSEAYLTVNCESDVSLSDPDYFKAKFGWGAHDWTFITGEYPLINYESSSSVRLTLTLNYVAPDSDEKILVGKESSSSIKYLDTDIQSSSSYAPIGSFMETGSLAQYYKADNGFRSFGYFFDEACTKKVPSSYLPMKNITLYVGFADVTPILNTYYFLSEENTNPTAITFQDNGVAVYSDGMTVQEAAYTFDGEKILLEGARLVQYFKGSIVVDEEDTTTFQDPKFDLYRYDFFNFAGVVTDDVISFYDGSYFTETSPLTAKKTAIRGEYYEKKNGSTYYYSFYGNKVLVEVLTSDDKTHTYVYDVLLVDGANANLILLQDSNNGYAEMSVDMSALSQYDAFKGTWEKSATVNKIYTFDGIDKWSYEYVSYERDFNNGEYACYTNVLKSASGTYTLSDGGDVLTFTDDGVTYTATVNADGFLQVVSGSTTEVYHGANGFKGVWKGSNYDLTLNGIQVDGYGTAKLVDTDGFTTTLVYEVADVNDASTLILTLYYSENGYEKATLYGYAEYTLLSNALRFVQPNEDSETGYAEDYLYLYDDYYGDWVCNDDSLRGVDFHFNGLGLYPYLGIQGIVTLTENGEETKVQYSLDSALCGRFSYDGKTYEMQYDEDLHRVHITLDANTSFERKDELANVKFVDMQGNEYVFDGKSSLTGGGKLTTKDATYTYLPAETGFAIYNASSTQVGSVKLQSNHYLLTIDGASTELYIANQFMGDWAISGQFALFHIGPTDTNGIVKAVYKGHDVEMTYLDPTMLTFQYKENKMPYTYYVYVIYDETIEDNILVLSEFTNLLGGDYFICSKANDLYGVWEYNGDDGKTTMTFDGVDCGYVNGYAQLVLQLNHLQVTTEYYYNIREDGIIMWSTEMMANKTWYFRLDFVPQDKLAEAENNPEAYLLRDENGKVINALLRAEVDSLFLVEAFDEEGNEYLFNGEGKLLVNGTEKYEYTIKSFNSNNTATLVVTDIATKEQYNATLDYKDSSYILFILGEKIVE